MKEKTKGMATVIRAFTLIFVVVPLSWISQDGTAKAAGASTVIVCEESSEDATADWHVMLERLGEAIQNGRGENVNFSVGNTFEVPVEILQKLAGKNATLALLTNNGITFSISGRDVRRSDIPVSADLTFESVIPEEAKKQAGGNLIAKEFSMKEKDPYPFCINLHVGLGEENAGKHAVLYSYDEASGAMKQEGIYRINPQGHAMFALNRGDEYVVSVMGGCTVSAGDTLSHIAVRNGVSLGALKAANPQIRDMDLIRTGQLINIPKP